MNYFQLQKNFYVLTPTLYNNNLVFVCRDKQSFLYTFFEYKNNKFVKVNNIASNYLKKIYYETTSPFVAISFDSKISTKHQQDIYKSHIVCRKLILDFVKDLPFDLQEKIKNNIDSLNYVAPTSKNKSKALYNHKYHTISFCYDLDKAEKSLHAFNLSSVLLHEMLHGASSKGSLSTTGFITFANVENNMQMFLNIILNEAFTEVLRYEITENNIPLKNANSSSLYEPAMLMFKSLLRFVDQEKLKEMYFSNSSNLLGFLSEQFHITNQEKLIHLSFLFDAMFAEIYYAVQNNLSLDNVGNSLFETGKLITELVYNKYEYEGKDFSKLRLQDIFVTTNHSNQIAKLYKDCLYSIDMYLPMTKTLYKKNKESFAYDFDLKKYVNLYLPCFVLHLTHNYALPENFPKKFSKSENVYKMIFSPHFAFLGQHIEPTKALPVIFDKSKNFLPTEEKEVENLVKSFIFNNLYTKETYIYFPEEYVIKVLNNDRNAFKKVCQSTFEPLLNFMTKLKYQYTISREFYLNVITYAKTKSNPLEILKQYYDNQSFASRYYLLYQTDFIKQLDSSKILNESQFDEFKDYAKQNAFDRTHQISL